ncbi:MAG: ABC-three component system protein [Dehalococcoidia bacterium]
MKLEVAFARRHGEAFQDLFADLMSRRHREDFIRMRPWGAIGDRKSDGYLRSERRLFQVYAPREMRAAAAVGKINKDFAGCLPYWSEYFDTWVFVHNDRTGLSYQVVDRLLRLEKQNPPLLVRSWGFEELLTVTLELSAGDLEAIFGLPPTPSGMRTVSASEIAPLLEVLRSSAGTVASQLRPPPADKIAINQLSDAVSEFLRMGMQKSDVVAHYLGRVADPTYGDDVARSFTDQYRALRSERQSPDSIFGSLVEFAGGSSAKPADLHAALAIVAYLFERCDIFESEAASGVAAN